MKQFSLLEISIHLLCGGIAGSLAGFILLFLPRYGVLVERPYSPYFVFGCGAILAGLAARFGDRLWSDDHIIPNRTTTHSKLTKYICWSIFGFGVFLALAMFSLSELAKMRDAERTNN